MRKIIILEFEEDRNTNPSKSTQNNALKREWRKLEFQDRIRIKILNMKMTLIPNMFRALRTIL